MTYAAPDTLKSIERARNNCSPILNLCLGITAPAPQGNHTRDTDNPTRLGVAEQIAFVLVIAMLETNDFFQGQIKQCNGLAARASNKDDREFWLRLAHRWEGLLQARQRGTLNIEVPTLRFERRISTRRRRAA